VFDLYYQDGDRYRLSSWDTEYVNFTWAFPVSLRKTILTQSSLKVGIEAGVVFQKLVAYPYAITMEHTVFASEPDDYTDLFTFRMQSTKQNPTLFFCKAGIEKQRPNLNTMEFNVVLSYSPHPIGKGNYAFKNLGYESYGEIKHTMSYIGLEFVYGFALKRRFE
jgi:hypothetical protein